MLGFIVLQIGLLVLLIWRPMIRELLTVLLPRLEVIFFLVLVLVWILAVLMLPFPFLFGLCVITFLEMSVEDVRSEFPIKTIPIIISDPTNKAINDLREALYANAAAISAIIRGGGQWLRQVDHGHIIVCEPFHYIIKNTDRARPLCTTWVQLHSRGTSRRERYTTVGAAAI